jgi:ATP-dependent DNA helicase RecG
MITPETISKWLNCEEDEHLEFKEAKTGIESNYVFEYCAALANEGGGHLVLGISPTIPRQLVGSHALMDKAEWKHKLFHELRLRIEIQELWFEGKRVVVISIPPRPTGTPLVYKGKYLQRLGESLVSMTPDQLKRIFSEVEKDFSITYCEKATLKDLHPDAISVLRKLWVAKSGRSSVEQSSNTQLLYDAELIDDKGRITYTALILLGTENAIASHIPQAEVSFEYRSSDATEFQQRVDFRKGFFLYQDELWKLINLRNDLHHIQNGLFIWDIPTFNERVIREAILNAVSHRDYRSNNSIFIRQYPKRIEIISPGGLPNGITPENILWKQSPRNRRIAEVFSKCGLVERSGQGTRIMFENCIRESKPKPDYSRTDDYQVFLTIRGEVQDDRFISFLDKINKETLKSFSTEDFLVLDRIRYESKITEDRLRNRAQRLEKLGIIERIGRGRGSKYIFSKGLYSHIKERGVYTRKLGLDNETCKALIIKHLMNYGEAKIKDFEQVLPSKTRWQIHYLLQSLKNDEKIVRVGEKKGSKWRLP